MAARIPFDKHKAAKALILQVVMEYDGPIPTKLLFLLLRWIESGLLAAYEKGVRDATGGRG